MSNVPPPGDPLSYASLGTPQPSRRPASVTTLGIIAIVLGSLGLLVTCCAIPQALGVNFFPNPVADAISRDHVLFTLGLVQSTLSLILAIISLWAGIGLLRLQPSARVWLIRYAVVFAVVIVAGFVVAITVTRQRMDNAMNQAYAANPTLNTPQVKTIRQYSTYGGYCFSIVYLIWPISILFYLNQPHVKAAFDANPDASTP